jgi:hypothetical protein
MWQIEDPRRIDAKTLGFTAGQNHMGMRHTETFHGLHAQVHGALIHHPGDQTRTQLLPMSMRAPTMRHTPTRRRRIFAQRTKRKGKVTVLL